MFSAGSSSSTGAAAGWGSVGGLGNSALAPILKRLLKFVLKRSVGRFLHSEPDLEQLDVQLGSGTFELRSVLLNCDAVNAQLVRFVSGWLLGF